MSPPPDLREACATGTPDEVSRLLDSARQQQRQLQYTAAELLKAAMDGKNLAMLQYLLAEFQNDDPPPWKADYTVVLQATDHGRLEEFKLLWRVDPSVATAWLGHPGHALGVAALALNIPLMSFLLEVGVDPNEALLLHKPVAIRMAESGEVEVMRLLLDYGAKVKGTEALNIAQEKGHEEMVKLLVERGGM